MNWKALFQKSQPPETAQKTQTVEKVPTSVDESAVRILEYGNASQLTLGTGGAKSEQSQHKN